MFAIGIFAMLGGAAFVACGLLWTQIQLPPEQAKQFDQLEKQFHGSLTTVFVATGIIIGVVGLYHAIMGLLVRSGRRWTILLAIITSFLVLGWCAISTLGQVVTGAGNLAASVCFAFLIGGAFAWLLAWLFAALSASRSQQSSMQFGQMQPPGPGTPAMGVLYPPPPPQPPSPEPSGWAYGAQVLPPPPPPPPPPLP